MHSAISNKLTAISLLMAGLLIGPYLFAQPGIKNVARESMGTRLFEEGDLERVGNARRLADDNRIDRTMLPEGSSLVLLDLPGEALIDGFSFFNYGATGRVSASFASDEAAARAGNWEQGAQNLPFVGIGPVSIPAPRANARFIRLEFQATESGEIGGLSVAGQFMRNNPVHRLELREAPETADEPVALTGLGLPSTITFIGTTNPDQFHMIDGVVDTEFVIDDPNNGNVAIIDLGEERRITTVSMLASLFPSQSDVFFYGTLEELADSLGISRSFGSESFDATDAQFAMVSLNSSINRDSFQNAREGAQFQEFADGESGQFQIDVEARYVVVRFPVDQPLTVYEISILGPYQWVERPRDIGNPQLPLVIKPNLPFVRPLSF